MSCTARNFPSLHVGTSYHVWSYKIVQIIPHDTGYDLAVSCLILQESPDHFTWHKLWQFWSHKMLLARSCKLLMSDNLTRSYVRSLVRFSCWISNRFIFLLVVFGVYKLDGCYMYIYMTWWSIGLVFISLRLAWLGSSTQDIYSYTLLIQHSKSLTATAPRVRAFRHCTAHNCHTIIACVDHILDISAQGKIYVSSPRFLVL